MKFDYVVESEKLKKKLIMLIVIAVVFTVIALVAGMGFGSALFLGIFAGFLFYIPGRIKSILKLGWVGAIIIGVAYNFLFVFLYDKLGSIIGTILYLLIPLADIGYSIYKVISAKKQD